MADWIVMGIALTLGMLGYVVLAVLGQLLPIQYRTKIGKFYLKTGVRSGAPMGIIRRELTGWEIAELSRDNEQELIEAPLGDGGVVRSGTSHRFRDDDDNIKRLWNKPIAITPEGEPVCVGAELPELAYHFDQKHKDEGLTTTVPVSNGPNETKVDPWAKVTASHVVADPFDAALLTSNSINSENITTAEEKTRARFDQYGNTVEAVDLIGAVLGGGMGVGAVLLIRYAQQNLLGGQSGGVEITQPISMALDVGVTII